MTVVDRQIERARALAGLLSEELDDPVTVLDVLDDLATLGLELVPIIEENTPSLAYLELLRRGRF